MGTTIKKRLAQSNITMLVIPLLVAVALVLLACYWLLTAAWLYRSAVNVGMSKSLWMILALVCNLLAVAAFLIVRDAPQRTRKAA